MSAIAYFNPWLCEAEGLISGECILRGGQSVISVTWSLNGESDGARSSRIEMELPARCDEMVYITSRCWLVFPIGVRLARNK
jgi:hypothetical protein